jgi:translocation and assembly module TamB
VGGLGVVVLLLTIGVGVYTRTDHFHRWLREQVVSALHSSLNGEVALAGVSGSVWEDLSVHGLSLRQNGVEVISVPQGTVSLHLLPQLLSLLRSFSLQISRVTLTQPVIHVVEDAKTGWNVAHLLKPADQSEPPAEPSSLSILLPQLSIENGQVGVRLADGQEFQLTALTVAGKLALFPTGMRADVSTLSFALAGAGIPSLQWSSSFSYEDVGGASRVSLQPIDLRTALSQVQLSGTVDNLADPILAVKVQVEKLAAADIGVFVPEPRLQQDLSGTIQLDGPFSALQVNGSLAAPNGVVTAAVTANLSQTPPDAHGTLKVERFTVDKVLHLPDIGGEVNAQVTFQGATPEAMRSDLTARVTHLSAVGQRIDDLSLIGTLDKGQIVLTAEAKAKAGHFLSRSQISLGSPLAYETTLTVRNLDTTQVVKEKTAPAANVSLDAWVKGKGTSLDELDAAVKVIVLPSTVGAIRLTQGQIEGTLRKGQLTLDKGLLLANDTTVNVEGQIGGIQKARKGRLSYNVQAKNVAPWLALAGIDGAGAVALSGTANGELTALNLDGKVSLSDFRIDTNALRSGAITYAATGVGSPQPRGQVSAVINGIQAGLHLRSVNADIALAGLQPATVQAEVTVQDEGSRTHRLKTQARYDADHLDVLLQDLAVQLPSGTWRAQQQAQFVLKGETLAVENFSLQQADQSISASGVLGRQGPLNFQLRVARFSLQELRPFISGIPEVNGRVDADVQVQGTAASPDLTVNISTSVLTVAGQSYAGLSAQGIYRQERLNLNALFRQDEAHSLSINGGLPLVLKGAGEASFSPVLGEADLRIRSQGLSLAVLGLVSKQIQDVQGTLTMDVVLQGPVQALVPSGPVRIQQGQVRVKPLGQTFSDVFVELQLAPDAVRVSRFAVQAGEGKLTGNGRVALQRYIPTDIAATFLADRFRVINTHEYRAALSGRVRASGSFRAPVVTGALDVVDTVLRPDLALMKSGPAKQDASITVIRSTQDLTVASEAEAEREKTQASPPAAQNDFYQNLAVDLTVNIPRDTWVYMKEGSIELTGNLRAKKNPAEEIALVGAIETVRGWVAFQNRKFRLERGNIVFTGATPIDPSLDVVAQYVLPEYKVDVVVGGTAQTPTVTFRSEPQLEQADILSLLLFGKPANALSKNQKTSLQSQALGSLAGSVASELRQSLAEHLGVDDLEFGMGESPGQGTIGVGKYIAPGVFVSTSQQIGGDGQGRNVTIEYQLSDQWQLKGTTTAEGNNGVDILWQKQY